MTSWVNQEKVKKLVCDSEEGHNTRMILRDPNVSESQKRKALDKHRKVLLRKIGAID